MRFEETLKKKGHFYFALTCENMDTTKDRTKKNRTCLATTTSIMLVRSGTVRFLMYNGAVSTNSQDSSKRKETYVSKCSDAKF